MTTTTRPSDVGSRPGSSLLEGWTCEYSRINQFMCKVDPRVTGIPSRDRVWVTSEDQPNWASLSEGSLLFRNPDGLARFIVDWPYRTVTALSVQLSVSVMWNLSGEKLGKYVQLPFAFDEGALIREVKECRHVRPATTFWMDRQILPCNMDSIARGHTKLPFRCIEADGLYNG